MSAIGVSGVLLVLLVAAPAVPMSAVPVGQERREAVEEGALLYRVHCASCHGVEATGEGPVAPALRERPPDLTRLAIRAGGVFPRLEVTEAIDGRREIAVHGPSEMPVWGLGLQDPCRVTDQETVVRECIAAVVEYLATLQVTP